MDEQQTSIKQTKILIRVFSSDSGTDLNIKIVSSMDPPEQVCRFCLTEEDLLTDCTLHDGAVQAKITTIFSFPFNSRNTLPSSICTGCYLKIDEYYEFTELVRLNQEQLIAREALTSQVNIKIESTKAEILEKPIVVNDSVPAGHWATAIKAEVTSDEVTPDEVTSDEVHEGIVQSQDEVLQLISEIEDTELQNECEPIVDRFKKTSKKRAEEDRMINEFFDLSCKTCSTQFDNFTRLKQHTREKHKKKLSLKCCNNKYSRRYELLDHIALHSNPHQIQCEFCDKKFLHRINLTKHRLLLHSGEEARPFKCDHCIRSYPRKHMLTAHMTKHDNINATCGICNQVYSNCTTLKAHMSRVHVEAAHECDICGKKFKRNIQLREHHAIHTGEKLYACNLCGLQMNSSSNLNRHKRKKHAKELAEMKER